MYAEEEKCDLSEEFVEQFSELLFNTFRDCF